MWLKPDAFSYSTTIQNLSEIVTIIKDYQQYQLDYGIIYPFLVGMSDTGYYDNENSACSGFASIDVTGGNNDIVVCVFFMMNANCGKFNEGEAYRLSGSVSLSNNKKLTSVKIL